MSDPVNLLLPQFLEWIAHRPRTYADVMEAWRTSCPRLPVWENAVGDGLVAFRNVDGQAMTERSIVLTRRGQAALKAAKAHACVSD
ncbi:MAG TPA: hypothetical protein VEU47_15490 [Candidatus Cybelea sp.]|nr:hypothetical protein [Candidatus Cybelea sp.]